MRLDLSRLTVRRSTLVALFLVVALGVLIGGGAALWVAPAKAATQYCEFDIPVEIHYQVEQAPANPHYGTKADMYRQGLTPVCLQVISVTSYDSRNQTGTGSWVEAGSIKIANGVQFPNCDFGSITGDNTWHPFRTYYRDDGFHCGQWASIGAGFDNFSVGDQYGNANWTFKMNGNGLGTNPVGLDFSLSMSVTNSERYTPDPQYSSASQSNYALFGSDLGAGTIQYLPKGGSWTNWATASCLDGSGTNDPHFKNDPDWHSQIHLPHNGIPLGISVTQSGSVCP
jgi:hypothetical protein